MPRAIHNSFFGTKSLLAGAALGFVAYSASRLVGRRLHRTATNSEAGPKPRVVILGGGFAGLETARTLQSRLPGKCDIVLVDRHNYQLFTPLLFQVATCGVDPYSITYPLRDFAGNRGIQFRTGTVNGVDFDERSAQLDTGSLGYDYLVIALGSTTNFFGDNSAQEHTLPLKWVEDAIAVRNHVLGMLEKAATATDSDERKALLTFAIVGGGATGVETAAALSELLRHTVPEKYPAIDPSEPRVVVIEAEGKLLGHMKGDSAAIAMERLQSMGVEVWLNSKAKGVQPGRIATENGQTLAAKTIIWATGVRAPDVVARLDVQHGKGGSIVVDQYLQVKGRPDVYAIGDNASVEDGISHKHVPLLAESAVKEGRTAGENIARAIQGQAQVPFHFRSLGTLVSLGRGAGIAQFGRFVIGGPFGAIAWHVVHLAKIPGMRDRLSTVLDWSAGYVHDKDTARLEMQPLPGATGASDSERGQGR